LRLSTVAIVGVAVAAAGIGVYKLGHAADAPANQMFTVAGLTPQAAVATAEANLATAVSAANSYRLDHSGFAGMSAGDLRKYDAALPGGIAVRSATVSAYCIESTVNTTVVSIRGPNGSFVVGACASDS
jgi:hypothetical protein